MMSNSSPRKLVKRALIAIAVVFVVAFGVGVWYVNDYYHANDAALSAVSDGAADGVEVRHVRDDAIAFVPANPTSGMIFYPGAKVQAEAYAPLLRRCAEKGVLCILLKAPFNIPLLNANAAAGLQEQFPTVGKWVISGHSMGGVAASDYLSRHKEDFDAVVFLASYTSSDLSAFSGRVLSLNGTEDGVLNRSNYEAAKQKLPAGFEEVELQGGNHAGFGNYGEQAGDGVAKITREEQQGQTVDAITALVR